MTGMESFEMERVQNLRPRPRLLILGLFDDAERLETELCKTIQTVRRVEHISEVDQSEWDCVVTDTIPSHVRYRSNSNLPAQQSGWTSTPRFDRHLNLIVFHGDQDSGPGSEAIDAPSTGKFDAKEAITQIVTRGFVVGNHIALVDELPPELTTAVSSHLIPAVNKRTRHVVFGRVPAPESDEMELRPFLIGPQGLPLAASYERNEEAAVWLLPSDVGNYPAFILAALHEWHSKYGAIRFPLLSDWAEDPSFRTKEEARLYADSASLEHEIEANLRRLEVQRAELAVALDIEKIRANTFERALLTEDGQRLQDAILAALQAMGFDVIDMDAKKKESGIREDYQIRDIGDPDWVCIADSKGSQGSARRGRPTQGFEMDATVPFGNGR